MGREVKEARKFGWKEQLMEEGKKKEARELGRKKVMKEGRKGGGLRDTRKVKKEGMRSKKDKRMERRGV